jgi:signal transduction histidine kinase
MHLLSIINDILDMSKIEAGKIELASEPVVAQWIVDDAVRMVSELARNQKVQIAVEMPADNIVLSGDDRAIKQIVLNVLSNAVKFSNHGGTVEVQVAVEKVDTLLLEIKDGGIGMTREELDRAMQPFGQAKAGITRTYGGTGLGLPITKGLVEAHGGRLSIDSSPNLGTLVSIRLPIVHGLPVSD